MARKKQQTYNAMIQMMGDMQKKIDTAGDHIAEVLASQLDYETARILGDLSDSELRLVADFIFMHIELLRNLAMLNGAKQRRLQGAENESMVEGELRYNYGENCWEVWDTDTGKQVGTLRDGMCVEFRGSTGEDWQTAEVGMVVRDYWYMMSADRSGPNGFIGLFDGVHVRFRGMDS